MSEDWNKIGFDYSAVQDARRITVFSAILARLKDSPPKSLLDYGGGDGLFAASCADLPIKKITLYDPAPNMLALARRNCLSNPRIQLTESSKRLPKDGFSVVTLNAVWMCLPTEKDCLKMLRDIHRLLQQGGELIATVTHPCFRDRTFSTYRTDFDVRNYLNDGVGFGVTISDGAKHIHVRDTHWSLSAMSRQLKQTGFIVTELLELADQTSSRKLVGASPWLVIFAKKVN